MYVQPWFWHHLHKKIQQEIDGYWWPKRWLYNKGIEVKSKMMKENYIFHLFYDIF